MKKNDLYRLIHSLSAGEHKLFKEKYAKADSTFVRLYDVIVEQNLNSDAEVKKALGELSFVAHLHKTKSYLYECLLGILLIPQLNYSPTLRILQLIQYAEVLIGRSLPEQAEEILNDALQLSQQMEDFPLSIRILQWLNHTSNPDIFHENLNVMEQEFKLLDDWIFWRKAYQTQWEWYNNRGKRDILKNNPPALGFNPENHVPLSFKAKINQLSTLRIHYNTFDAFCEFDWKIYELYHQKESAFWPEPNLYNSLFNIGLIAKHKRDGILLNRIIKELVDKTPHTRSGQGKRMLHLVRLKIEAHYLYATNESSLQLLEWINRELKSNVDLLNHDDMLKIYNQMIRFLMTEKNYDHALDYLIHVLNSEQTRSETPIKNRVFLLYQMIAHYELGNFDVLKTLLRQHQYFQKTNDTFLLIEEIVHSFLKKAVNLTDKNKISELKQSLNEQLKTLDKETTPFAIGYLKDIGWGITKTPVNPPENS